MTLWYVHCTQYIKDKRNGMILFKSINCDVVAMKVAVYIRLPCHDFFNVNESDVIHLFLFSIQPSGILLSKIDFVFAFFIILENIQLFTIKLIFVHPIHSPPKYNFIFLLYFSSLKRNKEKRNIFIFFHMYIFSGMVKDSSTRNKVEM